MTRPADQTLMLVPRTGPDQEPKNAALARWVVEWDFAAAKYKVAAIWGYGEQTWTWWTWAEEKKP